MSMPLNVLVTGSEGQLAKSLKAIYESNEDGVAFDFFSKEDLDITNSDALIAIFKSGKYDFCLNCAAYTDVEQAERVPEKAMKINAYGVRMLAEVCNSYDTRLIHLSTDYVFDGTKKTPYEVNDTTNPINVYGRSKLLGEHFIQEILDTYYIIRTSWLYSKHHGKNFYRTILKKAQNNEVLRITDEQKGCPTECENLAKIIYEKILTGTLSPGIYHYCDDQEMTWYDFAVQILFENGLLEKVSLIKDNNYTTFAARPEYSVLKTNL